MCQIVSLTLNEVNEIDACLQEEQSINELFSKNQENQVIEKLYSEIMALINEEDLEALNNNGIKQLNCIIFEDSYSYFWVSNLSKLFYLFCL